MGKKDAASEYATPTHVDKDNLATAAYTLTGDVNTLSECYISDMKTVTEPNYNKTSVSMSFRHLASKVRMALFEIVPGYVISDVKFYDATSTTATADPEGTLIGNFNNSGTLTVYFPTTGTKHATEKDYNKAHVKFTATEGEDGVLNFKKFGTVNYNNQARRHDSCRLNIPQPECSETFLLRRRLSERAPVGRCAKRHHSAHRLQAHFCRRF